MATVAISTTLETETCCACGMLFAMPGEIQRLRRRDHDWFYCPAGHSQHYAAESDVAKAERLLREEQQKLARERQQHDQTKARARDAEEKAESAIKKNLRHRKRAANGVCPCCKRSFTALARHMKTKHPTYATGIPA